MGIKEYFLIWHHILSWLLHVSAMRNNTIKPAPCAVAHSPDIQASHNLILVICVQLRYSK